MKEKTGKKFRELMVKELEDKFKSASNVFITSFSSLKVEDLQAIREKLRKIFANYIVTKNTLCKLALQRSGFGELAKFINGPCAITYGVDDPVMISKILVGFSNDYPGFSISVARIEEKLLLREEIEEIAKLPSRKVLLAQLMYILKFPIFGFVSLTSRLIMNFLSILKRIEEKTKQGGA